MTDPAPSRRRCRAATRSRARRPGRFGLPVVVTLVLAVAVLVACAGRAPDDRPRPAGSSAAPSSPAWGESPSTAASRPAPLTVVALGDSVTAGSACGCTAFPELYARALGTRYGTAVRVENDGQGGLTSGGTVTALDSDPQVRADVGRADVVLVTIGANDFSPVRPAAQTGACGAEDHLVCARALLVTLGDNLDTLLERIHSLRQGRPTAVLVTGYWNVFQDGDVADRAFSRSGNDVLDELTQAANAVIAVAAQRSGARYVDLYLAFKGADGRADPTRLLAADGDHPDAAGHRVIARALLAAGLPRYLTGRG